MVTFISHSVADTLALGEAWGRTATLGWIIGLCGELGTGKTQLVKGLAQGLGVAERVHSPTFALVNEYRTGRLPLFHLDLYRLETARQFLGAGLEAYLLDPPGVTVVEWFDRYAAMATAGALRSPGPRVRRVVLEAGGETERAIGYEDLGP